MITFQQRLAEKLAEKWWKIGPAKIMQNTVFIKYEHKSTSELANFYSPTALENRSKISRRRTEWGTEVKIKVN